MGKLSFQSKKQEVNMDKNAKSNCCNAPVEISCGEESEIATCWYVCTKCGEPCDIKEESKKG